jgi:hypothetical protein
MQTNTLADKSLKMTTWIHFMSKKKLIHFDWEDHLHTQDILNECLVFPTQWNCYHQSSEQQLSGTSETLQYHEALRKDIHFCKDSLRDKTVNLSFMEVNIYNWSDSSLFLQGTLQIQPNFSNHWMANWTRNIKYTHTNTHTHTHTHTHTKWQSPNCYLVNEFLNFYLLNSHVEQDQKSLNTTTPWFIPSILTMLKRDLDSRSLMHAETVDTLNESETVCSMRL